MHRYFIGIDIGTSGCKSIIIDERGRVEAEASCGYPLSTPQPGWCEQDPEDWWQAVKLTLRGLLRDFHSVSDIACIGLSGQMHGMVLLDEHGKTLRPCIIWADQRTTEQCQEIYDRVGGPEELLKLTNNRMLTGYTGGKILWVREHEPAIFEKARMILNPKDYIRFRLTGDYATEVSDASGTGLFDVRRREWSYRLLSILDIPKGLLPECHESTEIVGRLTNTIAREFGLPVGLPVVGGGGDAVIQSVGSGLVREGTLGATIGTGGQICAVLDRYRDNPEGKLQLFCSVIPEKWHAMGVMLTAGGALKWLKDLLYEDETGVASQDRDIYKRLDEMASRVDAGSEGLLFLPYLNGERCPHSDPDARGAFVGLSLRHRKAHMVRSVLEGVAFGLRDIAQIILELGSSPEQILVSGGAANSGVWRQIIADMLGRNVLTMGASAYGGAFGAALIAGTGVGAWSSVEEAAKVLRIETEDKPVDRNAAAYNMLFPVYRDLYVTLKGPFGRISSLQPSLIEEL